MIKLSLILFVCFFVTNLTAQNNNSLEGKWNLVIDKKLDGEAKGNLGCDALQISKSNDPNCFEGAYLDCQYPKVRFEIRTFSSNRGTVIQLTLKNPDNHYYAVLAGPCTLRNGQLQIKGIWTDVEGQQGDFELIKVKG